MNNNFDEMMNNILKNMDNEDDAIEFGNKLEEISKMYDFDKFEKEIEIKDKANYYLEKAENSKTKKVLLNMLKKHMKHVLNVLKP